MADVHPIITVLGVLMVLSFWYHRFNIWPVLISFFIILLKIYYVEFQSRYPTIPRKKNVPVRFNLPFLGPQTKRKKPPYASDRVTNKSTAKDFLKVNVLMNASNPQFIQPLDNEVEDVFNRAKNKAFKYGELRGGS
jgi:hypothetical protein